MAKVEMAGQEYLELVGKERELSALKTQLDKAAELVIDEEDNRPKVYYTFEYPRDIAEAIKTRTAEQLAQNEEAVRHLYNDETPCLVITHGYFTRDWGTAADRNTVDLRTNPKFKAVWDKLKAETEAEQEEE